MSALFKSMLQIKCTRALTYRF